MNYLSENLNYKKIVYSEEEICQADYLLSIEYEFFLLKDLHKKMQKFSSLTYADFSYDENNQPLVKFFFDNTIKDEKLENLLVMNGIEKEKKDIFLSGYFDSLSSSYRIFLSLKKELCMPLSNIRINAHDINDYISNIEEKKNNIKLNIDTTSISHEAKKVIELFNKKDPHMISYDYLRNMIDILELKKMELFFLNLVMFIQEIQEGDSIFITKKKRSANFIILTSSEKLNNNSSFKMLEMLLKKGKWNCLSQKNDIFIHNDIDIKDIPELFQLFSNAKSHIQNITENQFNLYNIDRQKKQLEIILKDNKLSKLDKKRL